MIPQAFEILDALPQLSSGKVNRAALPAVASLGQPARRYVAPRSAMEKQLGGHLGRGVAAGAGRRPRQLL